MVNAPKRKRTNVNVNGPTFSMPTVWATNAVPHITEANKRIKLPLRVFKFIIFY